MSFLPRVFALQVFRLAMWFHARLCIYERIDVCPLSVATTTDDILIDPLVIEVDRVALDA
jgi:hypothetical protein